MLQTVKVCNETDGECGGHCWRCRYRQLIERCEAVSADLAALRDAAAKMRHDQREYFRTRSAASIGAAKVAESRLDRLLLEAVQPRLFEANPF